VHEMKIIAILVEKLHGVLAQDDTLDAILGTKPVLGLRTGLDVAKLGLDHPPPVARRDVGYRHHSPQVLVVFQHHSGAELSHLNQHSPCTLDGKLRNRNLSKPPLPGKLGSSRAEDRTD